MLQPARGDACSQRHARIDSFEGELPVGAPHQSAAPGLPSGINIAMITDCMR